MAPAKRPEADVRNLFMEVDCNDNNSAGLLGLRRDARVQAPAQQGTREAKQQRCVASICYRTPQPITCPVHVAQRVHT